MEEMPYMRNLSKDDPAVAALVEREQARVESTLDLIAAENHPPPSIMETLGSVFIIKTIEGYPGRRYHAGCVNADAVEELAIARAKKLFGAEHVNVQPHSGTSANLAVYFSVLEVGDSVLSMSLPHGGHLSHGHRASITSRCFRFSHYTTDPVSGLIDYDEVRRIARKVRPRLIVAGASSYPRLIDYQRLAEIAHEVSAFLFADMAHLGGLAAAGVIPSPVGCCDFVTFTCYKTMMGGRGGVILCRKEHAKKIDAAVFPGCQGTSAVNSIAAKAVIFNIASTPEFVEIQQRTLHNAVALAAALEKRGLGIVTGGTDNHQVIVDLASRGMTGQEAEDTLESVGILTNRNMIPRDADSPGKVSGLRLGTAAVTTRGMGPAEMPLLAGLIDTALKEVDNAGALKRLSGEVRDLAGKYPVYPPAAGGE
jgi:glycine hydroxymethyltransferase